METLERADPDPSGPDPAGADPSGPHADAPARRRPLVPVLGPGPELVLRLLTLGWFGAAVWFWLWWLSTPVSTWNVGGGLVTAAFAVVFVMGGYYLFFACRMTRVNPAIPIPDLRVAMIVTKAPSEPWPVLQKTLAAMLAQDFPHPYDVWLADEQPSAETLAWCEAHGVLVSSRFGVDAYHQATWPRRTKTKEGNLAYFYDEYGYDRYDVVAQLDADHVPEPSYLQAMVRPFAIDTVGYVAAPSLCDANASDGWTVRGRVFNEAAMHGPCQAGANGGYAPMCIGSHYAVRTAALRDVGGLGPELAEDYTTTLWMQTGGWDGVFAIDAEAHGDGPQTLADMLTQELQWARSLGTILVRWAPVCFPWMPWRARLRMGFSLTFYLLQAAMLVPVSILPAAAVVLRRSWGSATFDAFYAHLWLCSLFLVGVSALLRRQGALRPVDTKLMSWERMLFQLVRWPWTSWGFVQGMWAGRQPSSKPFRVTPKGQGGHRPLRARLLIPTFVLGAVPMATVIAIRDPGPAVGLWVVAGAQGVVYLTTVAAVIVLHVLGNRRAMRVATSG